MQAVDNVPSSVTDILGQKFFRLTPVQFVRWHTFPNGKRQAVVRFNCDCGNTTETYVNLVKRGHTKSCGCYQRERRVESHTIHGQAQKGNESVLYGVWKGMLQRCNDPGCENYQYYGARGIRVLWKDFVEFERDMASTYQAGLTIGRKNNDGDYCKDNCKWETRREQNRNYRRNRILELNGERLPMIEWSERLGFHPSVIQMRLSKGWSVEQALTTPSKKFKRMLEFEGALYSMTELARMANLSVGAFWNRIHLGWPVEKAVKTRLLKNQYDV